MCLVSSRACTLRNLRFLGLLSRASPCPHDDFLAPARALCQRYRGEIDQYHGNATGTTAVNRGAAGGWWRCRDIERKRGRRRCEPRRRLLPRAAPHQPRTFFGRDHGTVDKWHGGVGTEFLVYREFMLIPAYALHMATDRASCGGRERRPPAPI